MPKIVDHDEYRQEMLEKCLYLFTRKGYSDISMKQIAAEIGVSTGTLYHYFSSKESIIAGIIAWGGNKSVDEYLRKTLPVKDVGVRFDMALDYWKNKKELYENIMLCAMNVYRNVDSGKWKAAYSFFSEPFISSVSERLHISRQFARSIFIHFVGLAFHSLAFDGPREVDQEIDFIDKVWRLMIVDAQDDVEKASVKFKKVVRDVLLDDFVPSETDAVKKNKKTRIKKTVARQQTLSRKKVKSGKQIK